MSSVGRRDGDVVLVLHRDDGTIFRAVSSSTVTLETPRWRIFPSALSSAIGAQGVLERNSWVDRMELIEVDPIETEPPQAALTRCA